MEKHLYGFNVAEPPKPRHGALSLHAVFETRSREILGKTGSAPDRFVEFGDFLEQIVPSQPVRKAIHVIVDNLSAHETKSVGAFLSIYPNGLSALRTALLFLA